MFYYEEGYEMEIAESAKNLIIARDKYLEAFFDWQSHCLAGFNDIDTEVNIMKDIMVDIEKSKNEEEKQRVTEMMENFNEHGRPGI